MRDVRARSESGLREDIRVGVQYLEAWRRGLDAVPLYNLMEDAARLTAARRLCGAGLDARSHKRPLH